MFVFIAHAEADKAAADELKAFLKRRGLIAETETGERGFRYLQATDVVIGLWSQKSVFSTHRMLLERRMLDAWADAQLVLVKLDHSILPVGLAICRRSMQPSNRRATSTAGRRRSAQRARR